MFFESLDELIELLLSVFQPVLQFLHVFLSELISTCLHLFLGLQDFHVLTEIREEVMENNINIEKSDKNMFLCGAWHI